MPAGIEASELEVMSCFLGLGRHSEPEICETVLERMRVPLSQITDHRDSGYHVTLSGDNERGQNVQGHRRMNRHSGNCSTTYSASAAASISDPVGLT